MSSNTRATLPTDEPSPPFHCGKRSSERGYLPSSPTKSRRMDPSSYFQDEPTDAANNGVDFAMELLRDHQPHSPTEPSLEFSVAPHRSSVGLRSNEFVTQICASVKACELPPGDIFARAPVDIVVALDVSGSMRVEKLDLCKTTLGLLIRELHHNDRFCLISFSDEAKVEVPMLKINDEQKLKAMHAIQHMHTRGRTNIASALSLASQVANAVKEPNKVRSVFLLTDGNANVGYTEVKDLVDLTGIFVEEGHNPHTSPISLHTFGYGSEPDGSLLKAMANATSGGSFYSVRDNTQVASAFGDAIGGILSVVAQNLTVKVSVCPEAAKDGAEIIAVHHERKKEISDGVFQVDLGDLYAEESRDLLFEVTLATPKKSSVDEAPIPHATVDLSYVDTIKHSNVGAITRVAAIARPLSNYLGWPNKYVTIQWMRVRTAKVIAEAQNFASMGEVDAAKLSISNWINDVKKEKFEMGASNLPLLNQLLNDLNDCFEVLSHSSYNAYSENELGVRVQAHFSQRCSVPLGKRSIYRTAQKSFRAQAFDEQM